MSWKSYSQNFWNVFFWIFLKTNSLEVNFYEDYNFKKYRGGLKNFELPREKGWKSIWLNLGWGQTMVNSTEFSQNSIESDSVEYDWILVRTNSIKFGRGFLNRISTRANLVEYQSRPTHLNFRLELTYLNFRFGLVYLDIQFNLTKNLD